MLDLIMKFNLNKLIHKQPRRVCAVFVKFKYDPEKY